MSTENQAVKPERTKTLGQWSAICAKSIREHLAPKGFAEIRTGKFKGRKKANIEFLSQETVDVAGKIAGGCVNHYRNRVKEFYKNLKESKLSDAKKLEDERNALKFWDFKKRANLFKDIDTLHLEASLLQEITEELDYISIQ